MKPTADASLSAIVDVDAVQDVDVNPDACLTLIDLSMGGALTESLRLSMRLLALLSGQAGAREDP